MFQNVRTTPPEILAAFAVRLSEFSSVFILFWIKNHLVTLRRANAAGPVLGRSPKGLFHFRAEDIECLAVTDDDQLTIDNTLNGLAFSLDILHRRRKFREGYHQVLAC